MTMRVWLLLRLDPGLCPLHPGQVDGGAIVVPGVQHVVHYRNHFLIRQLYRGHLPVVGLAIDLDRALQPLVDDADGPVYVAQQVVRLGQRRVDPPKAPSVVAVAGGTMGAV